MSSRSNDAWTPFRFPPYGEELEQNLMRAPRATIRSIQSQRLLHVVKYAYEAIPFYRRHWDKALFHPDHLKSIDDIVKIPTWSTADQRASIEQKPPFGDYSAQIPNEDVAFMLSTSGTTGAPRLARVGKNDFPGMRDIFARAYRKIGLGPKDLIQITFTYAPLGAAWCCTWAAEEAGVGILPASSGRTTSSERQVELMQLSGVTALIGTGSYLLHLADVALRQGYDPSTFAVRKIITAGELSSVDTRKALEDKWNAEVYDLFGSVDTLTWSSIDCEASRAEHGVLGMHIWEDACAFEVLDEDGRPVKSGQYGEMCVTNWVWRSSPKIRFRTGDLIAVDDTPCRCGRTLARMLPVAGRVDHVIRIRATSVFPMALENAVLAAAGRPVEWLVEAVKATDGDRLSVKIESEATSETAASEMQARLRSALQMNSVDLEIVAPGSTAPTTGAGRDPKVRRIFDRRQASPAAKSPS